MFLNDLTSKLEGIERAVVSMQAVYRAIVAEEDGRGADHAPNEFWIGALVDGLGMMADHTHRITCEAIDMLNSGTEVDRG